MKFLLIYSFLLSILLGVTAAPTSVLAKLCVTFLDEPNQVRTYGLDKVDAIKEAARQSQINVVEAIRIVENPNDQDNTRALRKAFGDNFRPHLKEIRESLIKIRDGVLKVEAANKVLDATTTAGFFHDTQTVCFGSRFHAKSGLGKAEIMIHERSHAFANTDDFFSKKDRRGLVGIDARNKEAHWIGYLWSDDQRQMPSQCRVRNADSYSLLGTLARWQYDVRHATPTPKANPVLKIIDEADQIKKHGQAAVDNVKKAALKSQLDIEEAIRIVDQDNKNHQNILHRVMGFKPNLHQRQDMRQRLERLAHQVIIVRDVKDTDRYSHTSDTEYRGEVAYYFAASFHSSSDKKRAAEVYEQRAGELQQRDARVFDVSFLTPVDWRQGQPWVDYLIKEARNTWV